jgi:pyrimidine operon attenuation protein/uracil phosphoribosyltransferase
MTHLLFAADRVRRTLDRLAAQVVEDTRADASLLVIGIRARGMALAESLAQRLSTRMGHSVPVFALDVHPFRDDVFGQEARPVREALLPVSVTGRTVLLVDDVLFTGRTARAAVDAVLYAGRPSRIKLAVLVDRGHREVPLQPDYVGRIVPTSHGERVTVDVRDGFAIGVERQDPA